MVNNINKCNLKCNNKCNNKWLNQCNNKTYCNQQFSKVQKAQEFKHFKLYKNQRVQT